MIFNREDVKLLKKRDDEDRRIREKYRAITHADKTKTDSTLYEVAVDSIQSVDLRNQEVLDSLAKKNGFPGAFNFIHPRFPPVHFILIHGRKWYEDNKKFLSKELEKGHILPTEYASVVDHYEYVSNGEPSYYLEWNWIKGRRIFDSGSLDADTFFERRISVGLSLYFYYQDQTPKKGESPQKTPFYEHYKNNKDRYNCVEWK